MKSSERRDQKEKMDIRTYLKNNVLLFDGSMGTYFAEKYRDFEGSCESANLKDPEKVKKIHEEYLAAGCRALKTNTFACNPVSYRGDERLLGDVIRAGMKIAQDAVSAAKEREKDGAHKEIFIFADIGPVIGADEETTAEAYRKLADLFLSAGAQHFLFETNAAADHLAQTAEYIKKKRPDAFIIVSFAVQPDGYTREGNYAADLCRAVMECGAADAFGLNCMSGASHLLELTERMDFSGKPLSVMPNAGYPRIVGSRMFYDSDPQYFAEELEKTAAAGASIIGGCCGTNPDHIAAAAARLSAEGQRENEEKKIPLVRPVSSSGRRETQADTSPDQESENRFWNRLSRRERVIAVELDPPRDDDGEKFLRGAVQLKEAGADTITIADCPTARARMDSSLMACKLHREIGIDTLPHMTCRDRNLNATKALLLGLSMEGVRNVLAVTGDPIPSAERDEVKSVYQFNSRMLAKYISSLNENEFRRPFRIYGALNVNARRFDIQLDLARKKIENGVCGFLTQPVLTETALENLKQAHEQLDAFILGGIIPVVSSRNGRFMNSEISGITVDEKIIDLYEGKTKEECTEIAVRVSSVIAEKIRPYTDGFYLMTPFYRTDIITRLIAEIRRQEG